MVWEETGLEPQYQRLDFGGIPLKEGKLSDNPAMGDNATVCIAQRLKGGSHRIVDSSIPRSKGPCIITQDEYNEPECVVMACGHAIHPDSLIELCKDEVCEKRRWEINCCVSGCNGKCTLEFLVKCGATQEELNLIFKGISTNYWRFSNESSIQTCPGCHCNCERMDKTQNVVRCEQCTRKNGKVYDFCWLCSVPWKSGHQCKASGSLNLLANCNETCINGVKCPGIRSCPKCGALIEHKEACKHMTCRHCKQEFCFVCLRLKTGSWQCGKYDSPCEPAPRQSVIADAK